MTSYQLAYLASYEVIFLQISFRFTTNLLWFAILTDRSPDGPEEKRGYRTYNNRNGPISIKNIYSYLLYSFIRSCTSIYLLNSIANNASNIDVYVRFTAGRTILAETDQVKTETGLVCYETDQFLLKYSFISIILVDKKSYKYLFA